METEDVKISVVIPIYNSEKYLKQCLESIIHQTEKNIEIICIDDNSSDNSCFIIDTYVSNDDRFVLIRNPRNIGAACTRNIGMQIANGKYVAFLDSDDYYDPNFLEIMLLEAEKNKADMCVCLYSPFFNNPRKSNGVGRISEYLYNSIKDGFSINTAPDNIFQIGNIGPTTKLYRRNFILDNNLMFQNLKNSNDIYFGVMSRALAKKIIYVPKVLVHYRVHKQQTSSMRDKFPYCGYEAWMKCFFHLRKLGLINLCRKSFFDRVIVSVQYTYQCLSKNIDKEKYLQFWREKGFKNVGMAYCDDNDFISRDRYKFYKNIALTSYDKISSKQFRDNIENDQSKLMFNTHGGWLFPFYLFQKSENIVLFGNVEICRTFYRQVCSFENYVNIIGIIDRKNNTKNNEIVIDKKNTLERDLLEVGLDYLKSKVYAYILICEDEYETAMKCKKDLIDIGNVI